MSAAIPVPNDARALARLLRFLSVEGVTGQEKAIAAEVIQALVQSGVPRSAIKFDRANQQIPLPTQTGNLIVQLKGTRPGPRRLFMTHLDTVPLCAGAKPVKKGDRIVAAGKTALGGDNRTGVAALVTLAATLLEQGVPHPPLTFLFTVREESGLWGARFVEPKDLGRPVEGYNVDGGAAHSLIHGAVGADRWEADIFGRASHAGVAPEQGISATLVASMAIAEVARTGWFGLITRNGKRKGTSNVGVFSGKDGISAGDATNVVTDYVHLRGECRSHDTTFIPKITRAYRDALCKAAGKVRDHLGRPAKVHFSVDRDYTPFRIDEDHPVVLRALNAARSIGIEPALKVSNGGLDANYVVNKGIPVLTLGAGQNNIHSIGEWVDLKEYRKACRLLLALATSA